MFKLTAIASALVLAFSFTAVNAVPATLDSRGAIGFFCGASTTCASGWECQCIQRPSTPVCVAGPDSGLPC